MLHSDQENKIFKISCLHDSGNCCDKSDWFNKWYEKIAILIKRRNYQIAIERIICFPIPINNRLRKKLLGLPESEVLSFIHWLEKQAVSPLSKLHTLDISLLLSDKYDKGIEVAQRQLDYFYSDSFNQDFELYKLILNDTVIELGMQAGTSKFDWYNLTLMAWGHTSKILNMLMTSNLDVSALTETYLQSKKIRKNDFYQSNSPLINDVIDPENIRAITLKYHAVGLILDQYPEKTEILNNIPKLSEKIINTMLVRDETDEIFGLICNPDFHSNLTGCFWGGKKNVLLKPFVSQEVEGLCSSSSLYKMAENSIRELIEDPLNVCHWILIHQIVDVGHLDKKLTSKFNKILDNIDYKKFFYQQPSIHILCMSMIIRHASDMDKILEFIQHVVIKYQNDDFPAQFEVEDLSAITEKIIQNLTIKWSLDIARKEKTIEEIDKKFVDIMSMLLGNSLKLTSAYCAPFNILSRSLAYEKHTHFHTLPLLVKSRPNIN